MKTTFVNRENTNEEIFRKANDKAGGEGAKRPITPFRQAYNSSRKKRLIRTAKMENDNILRQVTFKEGIKPWTHNNRRVGRPKYNWVTETLKEIWNSSITNNRTLDINNAQHTEELEEHMRNGEG